MIRVLCILPCDGKHREMLEKAGQGQCEFVFKAPAAVRDAVRAAGVACPGPDGHLAPEIETVVGLVRTGALRTATGLDLA